MYDHIIPECYIDTCLVNTLLGLEKKSTSHKKGVSTVTSKMRNDFKDAFSVGIIDRDKEAIDYLKEFDLVNKSIEGHSLLLKHKDNKRHHYIIQICPESETWICNVAKELRINLKEEYNLPDKPIELRSHTKKVSSKEDPRFKKLFKDIVKRAEENNFEPVLKLKDWLNRLAKDNYTVDVNALMK
jgi:ATP-dependent Clp protease ATP-binding subunit ClpA